MAIIKHNKLIETSYKLNSREQFFVLYLISKISQHDKDFREYKMHYSEIEKIINFDGKRRIANKAEVFTLMDKLNSEPIIYERGSIVGKSVWLQHMEHDTETDIFTFSLSAKLREYLMQLKEHFTKYNISNIVYLNSNALRLYEVLKRYQFKGECEITVEKVKFYLGLENRYPKFYEFKRWVLIPSQKEIEKYTDIRFDFLPARKEGKRILSLRFIIHENQPQYTPDTIKLLSKIDNRVGEQFKSDSISSTHAEAPDNELTPSKQRAFVFLATKGVNKSFILEHILSHPKVSYAPLIGFEDLYFKHLWKFFYNKTTVKGEKMAGAFVSWWKNGRLTDDGLHGHITELVIKNKKSEETVNAAEVNQVINKTWAKGGKRSAVKGARFDMEQFKNTHSAQYQKVLKKVKSEYEKAFEDLGTSFDAAKYRKAIEDKVHHECMKWLQSAEM